MSTDALIQALRSLNAPDAFQPRFDPHQWRAFAAFLRPAMLRAGDVLIRRGSTDRGMFLLAAGSLQVQVPSADGGRRPVAILRPGAVVGEPSLFGDTPRMAQVEAMSPASVYVLSRPRFEEMAVRQPELAMEVLRAAGRVMAERMYANMERGLPLA